MELGVLPLSRVDIATAQVKYPLAILGAVEIDSLVIKELRQLCSHNRGAVPIERVHNKVRSVLLQEHAIELAHLLLPAQGGVHCPVDQICLVDLQALSYVGLLTSRRGSVFAEQLVVSTLLALVARPRAKLLLASVDDHQSLLADNRVDARHIFL